MDIQIQNVLIGLRIIAGGRDFIKTAEAATVLQRAESTLQESHQRTGSFHGIRPIKSGGILLWPVEQIARHLLGEAQL